MRSLMARVKTLHLKNLFLLTWNHQPGVLICIYWLDFLLFSDVTILSWCLQAISSRRVSLLSWKAKASPTELRKLKHSTMAPESTSSQRVKGCFTDRPHFTTMRIYREIIQILKNALQFMLYLKNSNQWVVIYMLWNSVFNATILGKCTELCIYHHCLILDDFQRETSSPCAVPHWHPLPELVNS